MDSLTQITLGAAVGEIILGKKIGNRAMLWGAVGGTIPDLDVITGVFLTPIQELAAHRGLSHSIVFSVLGALLFGWMIHALYQSKYHRYLAFLGWFLLPAGIVYFISRIFDNASFGFMSSIIVGIILIGAVFLLFRKYFVRQIELPDATLKDWQWLMFWALLTHPLLDCFTTYGTQLFQPFSDYRVAFNTVAVADIFYTTPFLLCIILVSYFSRNKMIRRKLAWTGLAISSFYLMLCVANKYRVNQIWTDTLDSDQVTYSRYMTSPSILTNFLWTCIAETEDGYLTGQYSIFDSNRKIQYEFVPRNELGIKLPDEDPTFECLRWFSNGYYSVTEHPSGIQFNDLRFGSMMVDGTKRHYIFNFIIKDKDNRYEMLGANGGPPPGGEDEMLARLYERIKGN